MPSTCTANALYESLKFCTGTTVLPGIRQRVYFAAKRDIVMWPSLPAPSASAISAAAEYAGNFTLAADKEWNVIDLTLNKGMIECETQGEKPSRTFLNKATLSHPHTDAAAAAFARQAVADDLVYIIQQRDGKYRVLGNEMFETDSKPKLSTGEGATGEAGLTIEIEVTDICPAPFYKGTLKTEDGEIKCDPSASSSSN